MFGWLLGWVCIRPFTYRQLPYAVSKICNKIRLMNLQKVYKASFWTWTRLRRLINTIHTIHQHQIRYRILPTQFFSTRAYSMAFVYSSKTSSIFILVLNVVRDFIHFTWNVCSALMRRFYVFVYYVRWTYTQKAYVNRQCRHLVWTGQTADKCFW